MSTARKWWRLWAFGASTACALALADASVSDEARAAFLRGVAKTFAETDLHRGKRNDAVYEAVRNHIRQSPYLAGYNSRMASLASGCGGDDFALMLAALVADEDSASVERRASYYLMSVQSSCSRRMHEDRALLVAMMKALDDGRAQREQNYAKYVEDERALALKEEAERKQRVLAAEREARKAVEEARLRAEEEQRAAIAARQAREREEAERARLAQSAAPRHSATPAALAAIAGTFRCGLGAEHRIMHFGAAGEAVELVSLGGTVLGFAGLYRLSGERLTIRFVADNSWKVFAVKYQQQVIDDFAWKRSAIASQKVMEFRIGKAGGSVLRMESPRTKMLKSGEVSDVRRPDCVKLPSSDGLHRALAAHARLAMRYIDKEADLPPESIDKAMLSLGREIESKKEKELAWFKRAPGVLKMMATDRLLEELRESGDQKCASPRAALESAAAAAMGMINRIGESDLAKENPGRAEELAGRQLDPAFEEFLDAAGRFECLMAESSAIGL